MLTPLEEETRRTLYRQGLSDRRIAEQVNVTPEAITAWRRTRGLPAHTPHRKITPDTEAEMLRMYQSGMSDVQIARALGLSKSTVLFWRRRRGLAANFKQGEKVKHEHWSN